MMMNSSKKRSGNKSISGKEGTVVAIVHRAVDVGRYFTPDDLERLREMAKVRILDGQALSEIKEDIGDVSILTGAWGMPRLTPELLDQAPRLKAVCYAAGSVKGFATSEAFRRGVIITTAMHGNAIPVAEVTVALITLANKRWLQCQDMMRARGPDGWRDPKEPPHPGNYGAVVGLVGFGAVGRAVADRLQGMDLRVVASDPHVDAETMAEAGAEKVEMRDLADRSDVVSLHAPDIKVCEGMIDAGFLSRMKDGATLINTARGRLVREADLVAELEKGRLYAMLDVTYPEPPEPNHPFYRLPNCWLTPHRAGSSGLELRRMGRYAVDECLRIIRGEAPHHRVYEHMLGTMA